MFATAHSELKQKKRNSSDQEIFSKQLETLSLWGTGKLDSRSEPRYKKQRSESHVTCLCLISGRVLAGVAPRAGARRCPSI